MSGARGSCGVLPRHDIMHHGSSSSGGGAAGRGLPGLTALGLRGLALTPLTPTFNDESTSDVRVHVVTPQGDVHATLALHLETLREQSDYFFTNLPKPPSSATSPALSSSSSSLSSSASSRKLLSPSSLRGGIAAGLAAAGLTRGGSGGGAAYDSGPLVVVLKASYLVQDPETYVTTLRLFYADEEELVEEVMALGSLSLILDVLLVASLLQFHSCTAACVEFLESVPWSDEEQALVAKGMAQLVSGNDDEEEDARNVLARLPAAADSDLLGSRSVGPGNRSSIGESDSGWHAGAGGGLWDKAALTHALRVLLAQVITFSHTGALSPGVLECRAAVMALLGGKGMGGAGAGVPGPGNTLWVPNSDQPLQQKEGSAVVGPPYLPLSVKKGLLKETFVDLLQCLWSEQQGMKRAARGRSFQRSQTAVGASAAAAGAAAAVAACGSGGVAGVGFGSQNLLRTKSMLASRTFSASGEYSGEPETDDVLLRLKRTPTGYTSKGAAAAAGEDAILQSVLSGLREERQGRSARQANNEGRGGTSGSLSREVGFQIQGKGDGAAASAVSEGVRLDELQGHAIHARSGCLTWLVSLMIDFSMADEVFKWLATDLDFVADVQKDCRRQQELLFQQHQELLRRQHAPTADAMHDGSAGTALSGEDVDGGGRMGEEVDGGSWVGESRATAPGLADLEGGWWEGVGWYEERRLGAERMEAGVHAGEDTQQKGPHATGRWVNGSEALHLRVKRLHVVREAILGTMAAVVAKKLVVNSELRMAFVRLWLPILSLACHSLVPLTAAAASAAASAAAGGESGGEGDRRGSGITARISEPEAAAAAAMAAMADTRWFICGVEVDSEERALILFGFNELVLTLPAQEQLAVYNLWQQMQSTAAATGSADTGAPPSVTATTLVGLSDAVAGWSEQPRGPSGTSTCDKVGDGGERVPMLVTNWFSLQSAYKKWLLQLGLPCSYSIDYSGMGS